MPRILLLSAYDALSHRAWRECLVQGLDNYHWTVLTLPPRYFSWRIRSNAMTWAGEQRHVLEQDYDLVLATSMVDMASLRGLIPNLAGVPSVVYFHENQFTYPNGREDVRDLEARMVTIYSALCADTILFNSDFNRSGFLHGVEATLTRMPDGVPKNLLQDLTERSRVLPVPIRSHFFHRRADTAIHSQNRPLNLLWNHRWEHDKGPDRLLHAMRELVETGFEFGIHVVGQQFRKQPPEFEELKKVLGPRALSWGYMEEFDYQQLLKQCDVVLSTSCHDYQGLAVLEAVAGGCVPLVPDRLAYRELFADTYRYQSNISDAKAESIALAEKLRAYQRDMPAAPDMVHLGWKTLGLRYKELISGSVKLNR